MYELLSLFGLNIAFMVALWHMDVNHNLDREDVPVTRGIFHITPEQGYRWSFYLLVLILFAFDILFVVLFR